MCSGNLINFRTGDPFPFSPLTDHGDEWSGTCSVRPYRLTSRRSFYAIRFCSKYDTEGATLVLGATADKLLPDSIWLPNDIFVNHVTGNIFHFGSLLTSCHIQYPGCLTLNLLLNTIQTENKQCTSLNEIQEALEKGRDMPQLGSGGHDTESI